MRCQLKIAGGFTMLIIGGILALPGVPGPGIPIALLGLVILSNHFAWARKTLDRLKRWKKPGTVEEAGT